MKIFRKKINYPLILSTFLVISIIISYLLFFVTNHTYDQQGANIKNFGSISDLSLVDEQNIIEQQFISQNDNLDKIYFYINNTGTNNNLELSLINNISNDVIYTETKNIPRSDTIQLIFWDFENILDSKNINYSLIIVPEKNNGFELVTTPKDRYEEGELLVNTKADADSILAFSFDYYADNLFEILYERLPVYKTGIFKNSITFIILFIIILTMVFYTTHLIIKNILEED